MAKYSDIKGFTVQTLSTDTVASQAAGGAWASGGVLNTARREVASAKNGTQSATRMFTGYLQPGAVTNINESYNGTAYTEDADLNTARYEASGSGTSPAALCFGGYTTTGVANTESWNGSSWTEVNDLNQARFGMGDAGTSTSTLAFGGYNGPTRYANTETWNGTSWTEGNDLNSVKRFPGGAGANAEAVLAFGGNNPGGNLTETESYNGTSWTEVNNLNTARFGAGSFGIYTSAILAGGSEGPNQMTQTESWDGTNWTEVSDLATANTQQGEAGSSAAGLVSGGVNPSTVVAITEEWTAPSDFNQIQEGQLFFNSTTNTFKETLTDVAGATWAAGGNMVEGRYGNSGFGNHSNAITAGGQPPAFSGTSSKTEEYNGSAWSEVNDLNTDHFFAGALGSSYTAGIVMAGQTPPGTRIAITESWNGTNWTEVNDLNTARSSANLSATGTSTAGIYAGGRTAPGSPGSPQAVNESWDGTSWTEVNDLNTARYGMGAGGIQTPVLQFGGHSGTAVVNNVESWDGTSWTETTEMNTKRTSLGGTGSNANNILAFGGLDPPGRQNETEFWNGTSWTELNNLSTARQDFGSSSALSITNVIASGGETGPAVSAATEEWTVNLANKTITAS